MGNVKVTLVGDIFPANLHYTIGFGVASEFYKHKGEPWLKQLQSLLNDSDIAFGNLESPLIEDNLFTSINCFAGSYEFAFFLKQIGFNIVSIANNHILEQGSEGFQSTIKHLENHQIKYIGKQINNTSNIVTVECNNLRIGFVGFNAIQDIQNPDLYANYSKESILKLLKDMNEMNIDYKIISIHWGDEFMNVPSLEQIQSAHKFIDKGADIIVGHHPHVVQPVERYKNGLIFYSLGNFMFDMIWSKNVRRGLIVNVTLESGKDIKFNTVPIFIGKDYIPYRDIESNNYFYLRRKFKEISIFSEHSTTKYQKYYERKHKIALLYQRIMMKIFLLCHLNKLSNLTIRIILKYMITKMKFNRKYRIE